MARSVSDVILLTSLPAATTSGTPQGGSSLPASYAIADAATPQAGAVNEAQALAGSTPQAGGLNEPPYLDGSTPQSGAVNEPPYLDGATPQAGGELEATVGNMLGRPTDGSERPALGGLGVRANGSAFSEREELDVTAALPGLTLAGSDVNTVGQERALLDLRVDAEVEVYRSGSIDLVAGPTGQTVIYTPPAEIARLMVTRVLLYALDVSGVTVQPEVDLRKTALGDVVGQTALNFTATGQAKEIAAADPSVAVLTAEDLQLSIDVLATATTYAVELIVLGRAIPA